MLADLFNIYFADLGGLVKSESWKSVWLNDFELLLNFISNALIQLSNSLNDTISDGGRKESIFIGISQSSAVNGYTCFVDDSVYLVCINVGTIIRLFLLAHIMLEIDFGNKDLFTHNDQDLIYSCLGYRFDSKSKNFFRIVDSQEETEILIHLAEGFKERAKYSKVPLQYSMDIAIIAFEFILLHELHHVALGHLDPKNPFRASFNFLPESGVNIRITDYKHLQGIESCADWCAGKMIGLGFKKRQILITQYPIELSDVDFCRTISFSLKLCLSLLAFDVCLLEDRKNRLNSHPHPELRFLSFFDGFINGLSEQHLSVESNWQHGIPQGYYAITEGYKYLNIVEPILWSSSMNMMALGDTMSLSGEVQVYFREITAYRAMMWNACQQYFVPFLIGCHSQKFKIPKSTFL
ncbi:MAG: hypothetical protein IM539_17235 [Pseudanabaena sp. M046S1SP1A06QC]|nr:hypothetical protein [Pseudanabaena sp. M046S1SP1A06QC]